jgi:hypothetical protein
LQGLEKALCARFEQHLELERGQHQAELLKHENEEDKDTCGAGSPQLDLAEVASDELDSPPEPPANNGAASRDRLIAMEQDLCAALEAAQFEELVVRLGSGYYQFGEHPTRATRATVRARGDGKVEASVNEIDYEPIEEFISRITKVTSAVNAAATAANGTAAAAQKRPSPRPPAAAALLGATAPGSAAGRNHSTCSGSPATMVTAPTPADPAAEVAAAAKLLCANMLDPSWTSTSPGRAGGNGAAPRTNSNAISRSASGGKATDDSSAGGAAAIGSLASAAPTTTAPPLKGQFPPSWGKQIGAVGSSPHAPRSWSLTLPPAATSCSGASGPTIGDDRAAAGQQVAGGARSEATLLSRDPGVLPPGWEFPPQSPAVASSSLSARTLAGRSASNYSTAQGTTTAISTVRRSPQRRSPSPEESSGSRVSLGLGGNSGIFSACGSAGNFGSGNYGSGNFGCGGGNFGSGNFGTGGGNNHGSGSYTSGGSGTYAPGYVPASARSPRLGVQGRASPPRLATASPPRAMPSGQVPVAAAGGSQLQVPSHGGASPPRFTTAASTPRAGPTPAAFSSTVVGGSLQVVRGGTSSPRLATTSPPPRGGPPSSSQQQQPTTTIASGSPLQRLATPWQQSSTSGPLVPSAPPTPARGATTTTPLRTAQSPSQALVLPSPGRGHGVSPLIPGACSASGGSMQLPLGGAGGSMQLPMAPVAWPSPQRNPMGSPAIDLRGRLPLATSQQTGAASAQAVAGGWR